MVLEMLTQDQVEQIHQAVLCIFEEIGVVVQDAEAVERLVGAGCTVRDADRVRVPSDLVEKTISQIPGPFSIYGRDVEHEVQIGNQELHGQGISGLPSIRDMETGEFRAITRQDVADAARVQDALKNVHVVSPIGQPRDVVTPRVVVPTEFAVTASNTVKPIGAVNVESKLEAYYVAELAAAVRGGHDALEKFPLHITGVAATSPLTVPAGVAQAIGEISRQRIPYRLLPTALLGGTGPVTIAGTLAQQTVEVLICAIIGYTYAPGLPVVYCTRASTLDMSSGASVWTSPEIAVLSVWATQLCRRYNIPCDILFSTSSKTFDPQNGYEKANYAMLAALAGADFLTGFGSIADILTLSLEQLVIDDEILDMALWVARGCAVNEETLALEGIREAMEGKYFLKQRHTRDQFRAGALWMPSISDRQVYREWHRQGASTVEERARQRVYDILADHEVPALPDSVQFQIADILTEAARKLDES